MKTASLKSLLTVTGAAVIFGLLPNAFAQTNFRATTGTTSVRLDTATLASAASLNLSGANSTGTPFDDTFQVGFPFVAATDFVFSVAGGFAPVGGSILHSGSVTFNQGTAQQVILGNFRIGFDPTRVGGPRSGFFVENTIAPLGTVIIFDVGAELAPAFNPATGQFAITNAALLVSAELGGFLQTNGFSTTNLTGAAVGQARVDGVTVVNADSTRPELSIRGPKVIKTAAKVARVRGAATDDAAVRQVEFRLPGQPFRKVSGPLANWVARIPVDDQPVTVAFRSVDSFGNVSKLARVRIVRR